MARSTQTPPTPFSTHSTRSQHRRPAPRLVQPDWDCDTDESDSSEACAAARPSARPSRVISLSDDSDDDPEGTIDTDANLMSEDDAYLHDLAQATQMKVDALSQRLSSPGENREKLFAQLLDPGKRSGLRMRKYGDFVHPRDRQTLDVPKKVGKDFKKNRAKKFVDLWELYLDEAQKPGEENEVLLETLELFLADLMDCFDHPEDVIGWNPFAAMADLIEAGALVRTPLAVQSCSRLTLGADWDLLSQTDKSRIGAPVMAQLYQLHLWRQNDILEMLTRWSDKFPKESTCKTCKVDPWEIFLLTTVVGMLKWGTKYDDTETASDTSSEGDPDEEGERRMVMDSDDDDDDDDDSERDDHMGQASDSEDEEESNLGMDESQLDPRLLPLDDSDEPPRLPTAGLKLRQRHLKNYGPNQYILRIVSMRTYGCGKVDNPQFKVCPRCGYRFDGENLDKNSLAYFLLHRAVGVARQEIVGLQEVIDLPAF